MTSNFSMPYGLLGLGACGGNQTATFKRFGDRYPSFYINSALQDLRCLGKDIYYYQIPNAIGCHKDRLLSKNYLNENCDEILSMVGKYLKTKYIFVFAGLGGGTASGEVADLIDLIESELHSICIPVCTLPNLSDEPMQSKINAYECLKELKATVRHTLFLVDNNKQPSHILSNQSLAVLINNLLTNSSASQQGNFDDGEIQQMLEQGGYGIISSFKHHSPSYDYTSEIRRSIEGGIHVDIEEHNAMYTLGIKTTSKQSSFHVDYEALQKQYGYYIDRNRGFETQSDIICLTGLEFPMTAINRIYESIQTDKINFKKDLSFKRDNTGFKDDFVVDDLLQEKTSSSQTPIKSKKLSARERLKHSAQRYGK